MLDFGKVIFGLPVWIDLANNGDVQSKQQAGVKGNLAAELKRIFELKEMTEPGVKQ